MPVDNEFLKNLPQSPGVYLMVDEKGKVLYVGKAANLRSCVRSYFVRGSDERPRIPFLMERVDRVRTILTETEKEALILENNLIKQHRPRYNVNLRDDKSFFSLKLNVSHPFPRLSLVRTQKIKPDGERYFGPYSSARDARITLKFIQSLFPLRQCTERQFATCKRPCLNCQMKRCLCPCAGKIDPEEYARMAAGVTLLLEGRSEDLVEELRSEMKGAAEGLRFEEAARIRDRLESIARTLEIQNVSFFHLKDQDAVGLVTGDAGLCAVEILAFRKGKLLSEDSFVFRNRALDAEEIMASSIKQYYGSGAFVPKEIFLSHLVESPDLLQAWLSDMRGDKVTLRVPSRGQGARLVKLALKNAENRLLREKHKSAVDRPLDRIAAKLRLPAPPHLIEGYDISNIAASEPVGVKVAFREGRPDKARYRKYKMEGFANQDDPGMIHRTLTRRLCHKDDDPLPDLLLIDGGKSQLNAAVAAVKEQLGNRGPAVAALAKGRGEREGDKLYLPNRKNPVTFPKGDPGLMLLMRVRDESHRFVHTFHSHSRKKAVIRSSLDRNSSDSGYRKTGRKEAARTPRGEAGRREPGKGPGN
ncbi:MAG: excinuclease ABC subunit UvrC [Deltaproteobacteria bacterium]